MKIVFSIAVTILHATSALAQPEVFWASDPVMPGEAAMLIGHSLGGSEVVSAKELKVGVVTRSVVLDTIQRGDTSMKVIVPPHFRVGVYEISIMDARGRIKTAVLNRPIVYWVQGDQGAEASPGGWIRVFGRSIALEGKVGIRLVGKDGGSLHQLNAERATLWEASASIPREVRAGKYAVQLLDHAGQWNDYGSTTIRGPEAPRRPRLNVAAFGAIGDGMADDSMALVGAIAAAGKEGAEVFFPRGRYRLTRGIHVPPGVDLVGEGTDLVNLLWDDMKTPPRALIHGIRRFGLRDMTLYASNYAHFITNDDEGLDAGDVSIRRVVIRANPYRGHLRPDEVDARFRAQLSVSPTGSDLLRLRGQNLVVEDSDFHGGMRSIALFAPRGALVARNQFHNGRLGWYSISGADKVIFEDNVVRGGDLMSTGGGVNTLGGYSSSQNVYFGNNSFEHLYGWDREAITSDAGFGNFYGTTAKKSRGREVFIDRWIEGRGSELSAWEGATMFILGGRGMGQSARVQRYDKATEMILLVAELAVPPDETSTITVVATQQNYIFYRNKFVDTGVAIQYYGTSLNHIAAENESTRTAGITSYGRWYRHFQPSWYCQFHNNRIIEGNVYRGGANGTMTSGIASIGSSGLQRTPNTSPLSLGIVHRRNEILNIGEFRFEGGNKAAPGLKDVIVEVEDIPRLRNAVRVDGGVSGFLLRTSPVKP